MSWSIYNNTSTWEELTDRHKGALLLAANRGIKFYGFGDKKPYFTIPSTVYKALELKPLTMEESFLADWNTCRLCPSKEHMGTQMVAKGWKK
jgi:hypothetical protein